MATIAEFYVPDNDTLRELGRLQIRHGHLDHMLRISIKRMLGISITDPGYWSETHGMAAKLRKRARERIAARYGNDKNTADTLNEVLDDAEEVTRLRNRYLHSVWIRLPIGRPILADRNDKLKRHVGHDLPTVAEIAALTERVADIQRTLNAVTRRR